MVCVDMADILAVTLPLNRHHFEEVWVVTSHADHDAVRIAGDNEARVLKTNLFWEDSAIFNKWRALEHGLDVMGREGWLCVMDADVIWPKKVFGTDWNGKGAGLADDPKRFEGTKYELFLDGQRTVVPFGYLCSPLRRMLNDWQPGKLVPPESEWGGLEIHRNVNEWAGYTQNFHASDPVLGPPPWHQIDWTHAGGADSFFQAKWPPERKVRPPWHVLHLGMAGQNWFGRRNPEGTRLTSELWARRSQLRREGKDQFAPERI